MRFLIVKMFLRFFTQYHHYFLGGLFMNKADLINALAEQNNMTKKDADKIVNSVLDIIEQALKDGDKVQLMGFGSFEVKNRAARTALNPVTKEKMDIPASKVISFKAGKALKDSVQ